MVKYVVITTGYDYRLGALDYENVSDENWQDAMPAWSEFKEKYRPVWISRNHGDPHVYDVLHTDKIMDLLGNDASKYLANGACFHLPEGEKDLYAICRALENVGYCGAFGSVSSVFLLGHGTVLVYEMNCEYL